MLGLFPVAAQAARVLVLGRNGHVATRSDPLVPPAGATDADALGSVARRPRAVQATAATVSVPALLANLRSSGQMSASDYTADLRIWNKGIAAEPTLTGTPAAESTG